MACLPQVKNLPHWVFPVMTDARFWRYYSLLSRASEVIDFQWGGSKSLISCTVCDFLISNRINRIPIESKRIGQNFDGAGRAILAMETISQNPKFRTRRTRTRNWIRSAHSSFFEWRESLLVSLQCTSATLNQQYASHTSERLLLAINFSVPKISPTV